jgi:hypothetical protein
MLGPPVWLPANREIRDLLLMSDPTNLTEEKLRRTFAKLNRSRAGLEAEIRKSQLRCVQSKLARERRQREKLGSAPRLTVVTK